MRIHPREGAAPAADLEGLQKALIPTPADAALVDLREAIATARLGAVIAVALVEVCHFIGDRGTPMLFVHEVGPGAGRAKALFPPTPQGVAAAGAWVRKNLPSESES